METYTTLGDVMIGKNIEDNTPIVIPYKDRFSHTLILGPSGCGKSHYVMLPMIEQDMKNPECSITLIEPKGDLASKVLSMAKHYKREVVYFNPLLKDCPSFNPLFGDEERVIENLSLIFQLRSDYFPQFFIDISDHLLRYSLKVVKRVYGNQATLKDLDSLINNKRKSAKILSKFYRLNHNDNKLNYESSVILKWFLEEYFNENKKTFEFCSELRAQVEQIVNNEFLSKVLNPSNGENVLDFDKLFEEGGVFIIDTARENLSDSGRFLSYFVIFQLQSAAFKRQEKLSPQRPNFVYIDEFQMYANPIFAKMLCQIRPSQIALHLATQNNFLVSSQYWKRGGNYKEEILSMVKNILLFPQIIREDAVYYSKVLGGLSSNSIQYRPYGEFTARIVNNNRLQSPVFGKVFSNFRNNE